jgi:hypothetical protein
MYTKIRCANVIFPIVRTSTIFFNHIVKIFQYQFRNIMTSSAKALIIFPNGRGEGSLGSTVVDVGHVAAAAKILTH